jgi:hypothetical protein
MGNMRCIQYFVRNSEGKRPLGRWDNNIKTNLKEIRNKSGMGSSASGLKSV